MMYDLQGLLEGYVDGNLESDEKMELKDELHYLLRELHDEGIKSGKELQTHLEVLDEGNEIPKLYGEYERDTLLGKEKYRVMELGNVRKIQGGKYVVDMLIKTGVN